MKSERLANCYFCSDIKPSTELKTGIARCDFTPFKKGEQVSPCCERCWDALLTLFFVEEDKQMSYYVFYDDDYADNGGLGLVETERLCDALAWIEDRMQQRLKDGDTPKLLNYNLIQGKQINLEPVEFVTKLRAKS